MPRFITDYRSWSTGDVIAGVTVAVTSLPQYIAYAELAQLSGFRGILASGPPLVVFAFLTGNPCLNIGVTSITALMATADLKGGEYREMYGEAAWSDILGCYSMMVGVASVALAFLGAGRLVRYIPSPVKAGWKLGFAMAACAAQAPSSAFQHAKKLKTICELPLLHGAPIAGGAANMYRLAWTLTHPQHWDADAVLFSAITLFIVMQGKNPLKVIAATIIGATLSWARRYPGDVVGLPPPGSEMHITGDIAVDLTSWVHRWPWDMPIDATVARLGGWPFAVLSAVAFAFVDYLAILSVEAERPAPGGSNPSREMVGQGVACIASGMAGSAPIGGSLTRSMLAGMVGASSPIMGLITGLATMCLGFHVIATLLEPTPKAVLSSTVLAAVLPAVVSPKDLLVLRGSDALVGWFSAAATCLTDPTKGFGIGCAAYFLVRPLGKRAK
ncbi:unnamed protein product [Effrenium voratum]|nr:unnamed protein product [Effrenium voratum]